MKATWSILLALAQLAAAQLEFDSTSKEVHTAPDATTASAIYNFTNKGKAPIKIKYVDPDCNCLGVVVKDGKMTYAPGESGSVRATFKVGNSIGIVDQMVAIWLEGDPKDKPSVNLSIRIHIPELVSLDHKTLKWDVGSEPKPQSIQVTMHHTAAIHVTQIGSTSKDFSLELITHEKGSRYEVVVTPKETTKSGMAVIRIETDCPVDKQKIHQAFAMILKPESP